MRSIPKSYLTQFLDNLEGKFYVQVRAILKPVNIVENIYIFKKFSIESDINIVFETNKGTRPISALACKGIKSLEDSELVEVSFEMMVSLKKSCWNGYLDTFANASLYSRRYFVLPEPFEGETIVFCRKTCRSGNTDQEMTFENRLISDVKIENDSIDSNLICGELSIRESDTVEYFLKYACTAKDECNPAKAAIIGAYVAIQSLID